MLPFICRCFSFRFHFVCCFYVNCFELSYFCLRLFCQRWIFKRVPVQMFITICVVRRFSIDMEFILLFPTTKLIESRLTIYFFFLVVLLILSRSVFSLSPSSCRVLHFNIMLWHIATIIKYSFHTIS